MANISLHSAATGLSALNTQLDVIANNLANVNTLGYKASRVNFQDLLYQERAHPGVENANGDQRPTGLFIGLGVKVSGTQVDFRVGAPESTGRPLDMFIEGDGFFMVRVEDDLGGGVAYTRAGNFAVNSEGQIVLASSEGRVMLPEITIPDGATVNVAKDGTVSILEPGGVGETQIGRIEIATFVNPAGLRLVGENLYLESPASGAPGMGDPLDGGRGGILQGFLEGSNVDAVTELITLIKTQRAFEMNSQVIQAANETLQEVTNLRRF